MAVFQKYQWINPTLIEDRIDVDYYGAEVINILNKIISQQYDPVSLSELVIKKQSEPQTVSSMFNEFMDDKFKYPVLTMKNLKNFYIDYSNAVFINDEDFYKLIDFELKPGMIIYGLTGSLGKASVVPSNISKAITNRRIAQICIDENKANPYYIAAFLNTEFGLTQFYRLSTGGVQPNLRLEDSMKVILPLPELKIQNYVGNKIRNAEQLREEAIVLKKEAERLLRKSISEDNVLNIFNENMSLTKWVNQEIIETGRLDADFYKEAYVNFDEYIFQNKDNFTKLKDIASLSKKRVDFNRIKETFVYLDISSLNEDTGLFEKNLICKKDAPNRAQKLVCINDILISTVRPNRKGIGIVTEGFENQVASTGFALLQANKNPFFLFLLLQNDIITKQLIRFTSGGMYPAISEEDLMQVFVPIVDQYVVDQIEEKVKHYLINMERAEKLISQAIQDVVSIVEGTFDESNS